MNEIAIYGCRENNLKNIDIKIPYSKIVCFIGVSGSGKSTIVFDTLYAEGKRRYIESLGVNEAYYLSKIKRPEADCFVGIPPAIALAQNVASRNPRSSVGSISQIGYYLQVLFSSCGENPNKIVLRPSMFNINSPNGCCEECGGEGVIQSFDETLIWPDQNLSVFEGGLKLSGAQPGTAKMNFYNSFLKQFGFDINTPIKDLSNEAKVALLFGQKKNKKFRVEFPGIIVENEQLLRTTKSLATKEKIESFMSKTVCNKCRGSGYNSNVFSIKVAGKTIVDCMNMSIEELYDFFSNFEFADYKKRIVEQFKEPFLKSLKLCIDLGVGYLNLSRRATTLSGGELQRLKLVSQISSEISGVVYVLDEPSSGLHMSDIRKIIFAIKKLNSIGSSNTIVLVEHTAQIINASDYIFEIGPGAGANGGNIIFEGTVQEIWNSPSSLSGNYLSGREVAGNPNYQLRYPYSRSLILKNINIHNINNISVEIPLCSMVCITGVSGSGKTSLVFGALYQSIHEKKSIGVDTIDNVEQIKSVILCDQTPIGKSTRSCPATYLDIWEQIRKIFADQPMAQKNQISDAMFSFNAGDGRCPKCKGEGILNVEMGFLPAMTVICDECEGKRFKKEVLAVKFKGLSISDVLELSVDEALSIFNDYCGIKTKLVAMQEVGLGYVKLGQSTASLSGGENQRLKLANEISKTNSKDALIIFDEPTKGLHFLDVKKLISVIRKIVNKGNSVIIVEHNLDVISSCDYIIDMGPGGGIHGGKVVGTGTPMEISQMSTLTGMGLKEYYSAHKNNSNS